MKARRIFRAIRKHRRSGPASAVLRDKLQKEKPSLGDLVRTGDADPDAVMTGLLPDVWSTRNESQALTESGGFPPRRPVFYAHPRPGISRRRPLAFRNSTRCGDAPRCTHV